MNLKSTYWDQSNIQDFWGEIAPCDHLVQVYENEKVFLNTLEGLAGDGFLKGESVIVIATAEHIQSLNIRLIQQGFDIDKLRVDDQYIELDAREAARQFMVNNWPDETMFHNFVSSLLTRAQKNNRKVRVFGEIVAILWEEGHNGATVQLENLWHGLQHT